MLVLLISIKLVVTFDTLRIKT